MVRPWIALVLLMGASAALLADDPDLIQTRLSQAKTAQAAEVEKFQTEVGNLFVKREAAARRDGNKKLLEQINHDRKVFECTGELPASAPKQTKEQAAAIEAKIERAYKAAIRDYTRAKRDAEADAVEKELGLVKLGIDPSDPRRRWVHSRGQFQIKRRGVWDELTPERAVLQWIEIARTREYVEVEITLSGTRHYAKLMNGQDGRRSETEKDYHTVFQGKWAKE